MFADVKPELKIVEMRTGIFKIDDSGLSNAFLVVGEEKACLIDTANGLNDIGWYCQYRLTLFLQGYLMPKQHPEIHNTAVVWP